MIESITIQNFESWAEVHLDFHQGVNAIIGLSDKGKSSLIRAMDWVINNDPSGDSMLSHWLSRGEETKVTLRTTDSHEVTRLRSKSRNLYILNGQELEAPGRGAPPEGVVKALNFSDINIQRQVESFFLVNFTPGEVARYLNRVVDLEEIDNSQSYAIKEVVNHKRVVEETKQSVVNLNNKLEVLTWVTRAEAEYKKLITQSRVVQGREGELSRLDTLLYRIEESEGNLSRYGHVPEMRGKLDVHLETWRKIQEDDKTLRRLHYIIEEIERTEDRLRGFVRVPEMREKVDRLTEKASVVREREKYLERLDWLIESIEMNEARVEMRKKELKEAHEEFDSAFPDRCPLCGREG